MSSFYCEHVKDFLMHDTNTIIGQLTSNSGKAGFYQQKHSQTRSWEEETTILKEALVQVSINTPVLDWGVLLEYPIPRRAKRIDAVILAGNVIFVLEFKIGAQDYFVYDRIQVEDYCLDLRDFHKESNGQYIIPILVASEATFADTTCSDFEGFVPGVLRSNKHSLGSILTNCFRRFDNGTATNLERWDKSEYVPTPTIIEAAQHLYSGKNVKEISRSQAGANNLTKTTDAVIEAINKAKRDGEKIICFITGVPGAGKTLAGLNVVHNHQLHSEGDLGVFLSGNGPLVKVLSEALAKDHCERTQTPVNESRRHVSTFIQNVHHFLDAYFYEIDKIPVDHVVLFDEAQRAWNSEQSKRKFNRDFSEPEMMLSIMDRQSDWAVIVALVGGGQEINTGEAGLAEWGENIKGKFPHWKVYVSPELKEGHHSTAGLTLFEKTPSDIDIFENSDLHLKVSIRSYKAELLSQWVTDVLEGSTESARTILQNNLKDYPIVLTRNLEDARSWLMKKCRGSRRCGLVATSGARRLRPYGLEVKLEIDVPKWFLQDREDVRSSSFLELAATEFDVQGLELDWVGVCWDADLRRNADDWGYFQFKGSRWNKVNNVQTRQYILNKYRVLLTRGREGLIIWVPKGSSADKTRSPEYYDGIAAYLKSCGIPEI